MNYNPGLWLALCSIFGGTFGVFAGGWLSDQLVKKWGLHSRLWLLSVTTVIFAAIFELKNNIGLFKLFLHFLPGRNGNCNLNDYFWPKSDSKKWSTKKMKLLRAERHF